jgi:integrase
MDRAGIPRECPEGRARELKRNVHSLRHTFAKRALEGGRSLFWLSRYLGHSDTSVTDKVYGHLEADRSRQEVDELTHIV